MIKIAGSAIRTQEEWVARIKEVHSNPNYPQKWGIDISIEEFVKLTFEKALEHGVRPDALLALFIVEKGWTMAAGRVPPEAHNPGNLGALDQTQLYESFVDWATGIRGAAQHLAIYAGLELIKPIDDPRAVIAEWGYKGIVEYVEQLGGTVNGKVLWSTQLGYGNIIANIINNVKPIIQKEPAPVVKAPKGRAVERNSKRNTIN